MRVAVDDGMLRSPKRTSASVSSCFIDVSSDCGTSKSLRPSSVTNFTMRSGPTTMAATPAATSTLATEVIAGEADSMGNGRMGAFGNGSSAGAVACIRGAPLAALAMLGATAALDVLAVLDAMGALAVLTSAAFGGSGATGGGAGLASDAFPFARGLSHF